MVPALLRELVTVVLVAVLTDVEVWVADVCAEGVGTEAAACGLTNTLKPRTPPTAIRAISETTERLCMHTLVPPRIILRWT